jgi:hypothetical protein
MWLKVSDGNATSKFSASRHWVWVVAKKKAKQSTQHLEILLGTFI